MLTDNLSPFSTFMEPILPHTLHGEEADFLTYLFDDNFIQKLLHVSNKKIILEAIKITIAHTCFDNIGISSKCISILIKKLAATDLNSYPTYLAVIEAILQVTDQFQSKKAEAFVQLFTIVMTNKLNESYIPFNAAIDMFLKIENKCQIFSNIAKEKPGTFNFLKKWLDANPYPIPEKVLLLNFTLNRCVGSRHSIKNYI